MPKQRQFIFGIGARGDGFPLRALAVYSLPVLAGRPARCDSSSETHGSGDWTLGRLDGSECSRNELLKLERISHFGVALGSGPAHLGSGAIRRWRGIHPAVARGQGILEMTSLSVKDFRDFRLSRGRRRGDYRSGKKKQRGAA